MNNKNLSEGDLCDKVIRPAVVQAGWHPLDQICAQFPLRAGRVVVEAKKSRLSLSAVLQQAIGYAELLEVSFSFCSNGDGFVYRDATLTDGVLEQNITLD